VGVPQNGRFIIKKHFFKVDDLGVSQFQETPILANTCSHEKQDWVMVMLKILGFLGKRASGGTGYPETRKTPNQNP